MARQWLQEIMASAAVTRDTTRSSVAQLPTMDKLAEQIRIANNELVAAQATHARIELARDEELREFEAMLGQSRQAQAQAEERLRDLQTKLAEQVRALGIKAEVVRPAVS